MTQDNVLQPIVNKFFEHDLENAVHLLESMTEEDAVEVLKSLPMALAVRVVKALQISYAATLLKNADDVFVGEVTSHLEPQLAASILMHLPPDARERMAKHDFRKTQGADPGTSGVSGGQHRPHHDNRFYHFEKAQAGGRGH